MMTYEELITTVSRKIDWPESQTEMLLGILTTLLKEQLLENRSVSIDDFGIFNTSLRPEFISFNPETRERYLMPPAIEVLFEHAAYLADRDLPAICFEPDESLLESVNSSFACFEPTLINEGVEFPDIPIIIAGEYPEEETSGLPQEADNQQISEKTDSPSVPEPFEEVEISEEQKVIAEPVPQINGRQHAGDDRHRRPDQKKTKRHKTSAGWIPIMSGVAIVLAALILGASAGHSEKKRSRV